MSNRVEYIVRLEVRIQGPDSDWDRVALKLAGHVASLRFDGFRVTQAELDEACEGPDDD
jgi:hypothetical protein